MDNHLKQTFDFRYIKIGSIVNGGVLQIGCGGGIISRLPPVAYTTVGGTLVGVPGPPSSAVPLQAPQRQTLED